MKITKKFRIFEIRSVLSTNAPIQIILEGGLYAQDKRSALYLNQETCARYGIPMPLDTVGRDLVCSFESRELPPSSPHVGLQLEGNVVNAATRVITDSGIESDDLAMRALEWCMDALTQFRWNIPQRILRLESFRGGDGIHPTPFPCPYFTFFLNLTEEEFEGCKSLPANTVFKVNFRLK